MFGYRLSYILLKPHIILKESYYHIKWFFQRGWRGYADCDTWDLYAYLLEWLPDVIASLAKNKHGHPIGLTSKKWKVILYQMEEGLRAAQKVSRLDYPMKQHKYYMRQADKGLDLFRKHFFNLWD